MEHLVTCSIHLKMYIQSNNHVFTAMSQLFSSSVYLLVDPSKTGFESGVEGSLGSLKDASHFIRNIGVFCIFVLLCIKICSFTSKELNKQKVMEAHASFILYQEQENMKNFIYFLYLFYCIYFSKKNPTMTQNSYSH